MTKFGEILNEIYGPVIRDQLAHEMRVFKSVWKEPSEEEMAAWREKRDAEEAFWNEQSESRKDDPVMQLHSKGEFDYCKGCDFQGYDGEPPEWPCRTVRLICTGDADFVWGKK